MPQYNTFEVEQQQDIKDEMSTEFDSKAMDLANLYIGDAAIPGLLQELMDLNDKHNDYVGDIESGGYDG